ncbi:hypothetical protein NITGR_140012 [Nitrospina gracilis 3/211]|uniref:Uncharacterized protein n=1 Tax=Nitrospina gracilis (strain 3/211) TaxID=1266370 RepID=M1YVI9_NITG3|nr:hypothetical protein NITGR_140012 [Nitrospina gracilis 3/211]
MHFLLIRKKWALCSSYNEILTIISYSLWGATLKRFVKKSNGMQTFIGVGPPFNKGKK